MTTISEAVARYLVDRGEQVENQYLRIMCPVNVHDKEVDTTDLAGNRVSAMFPRLPAWPLGAKERHTAVLAEMSGIKERHPRSWIACSMPSRPYHQSPWRQPRWSVHPWTGHR